MRPLAGITGFELECMFVFTGYFLIHWNRLAIHIRPAAAVGIYFVEIRIPREMLALAIKEKLAEIHSLDTGRLEDTAFVS